MTDTKNLKELAERATPGPWSAAWEEGDDTAWPNLFPVIQAGNGEVVIGNEGFYTDLEQDKANATFCAAANPQAILGLIDEVERLRSRLEIDERIPHDGISCRDETIKVLDEKCDKLKAENDALRKFSAEAYQVLGALDAPENVLDNASDAANGVPLRHETLLPFFAEDYDRKVYGRLGVSPFWNGVIKGYMKTMLVVTAPIVLVLPFIYPFFKYKQLLLVAIDVWKDLWEEASE
ncbi:ead/Ea22-like family protein [Pseudomonas aeruginosa]|uniref:ead/Ea22-like family protein n=1 Tax=Pseudomonas aeruginosa TaxID=287 RepID=UPI001BD2E1C3|nr:ead/Ea22-like family protein [Pseudomonas aeruginosa]MBS9730151.1 ead/Ea22-like family protein [Pseudomonas aeruginosa]